MFTVKAYRGSNLHLYEAERLTILRDDGAAEITLHRVVGEDNRIDVGATGPDQKIREPGWPPVFDSVIIENAAGKTTEVIRYLALGRAPPDHHPV